MTDERPPRCVFCGRNADESESERLVDHDGREWWTLWTYCRPCDYWTEHRPEGMPDYL